MSERENQSINYEGSSYSATGHAQHSRAVSGISHVLSVASTEASVDTSAIPLTREQGSASISPPNPSLGTPHSTQPQEAAMRRGIRRHMESNNSSSGSNRNQQSGHRSRVAVRSASGSFLHPNDTLTWSSPVPPSAIAGSADAHGVQLNTGTASNNSSNVHVVYPAPYWQNTQQAIPRAWWQHAMSPTQQMLRTGTPNSHSMFGPGDGSSSGNLSVNAGSRPAQTESSALFATSSDYVSGSPHNPPSASGMWTPSTIPVSFHKRVISQMEPPPQLPLIPPYDSLALSQSATLGDFIMGHSPVGNVSADGNTSGFDSEANDAIREYTDAIRRRQQQSQHSRSSSYSQTLRSAQYRPLPIPFGAPPRNSPWQLQLPLDSNGESLSTEEALNSGSVPVISPPDTTTVDSVLATQPGEDSDTLRMPNPLANTQRPAAHKQQERPRRNSLYQASPTRGRTRGTQALNNILTLSQSQPSLSLPTPTMAEPLMLTPSGSLAALNGGGSGGGGSGGSGGGVGGNAYHQRVGSYGFGRATFPWDLPSPSVPSVGIASPAYSNIATLAPNSAMLGHPGTPNSLWMRNATENSLQISSSRLGVGGAAGGGSSSGGLNGSGSTWSSGDRGAGGDRGAADNRRSRATPGSVENHPLSVATTCYEEMSDLLELCRLLDSDVDNVYGIVPASLHGLQVVLVNVLTSMCLYLRSFYVAFCNVSGPGLGSDSPPPPRPTTNLSASAHTTMSGSLDHQESLLDLAQQLIADLDIDLLPPLAFIANVETTMQESRRRKEIVAYWGVEVTSTLVRQLNSALMAPNGGEVPSMVDPAEDDMSIEASIATTVTASAATRPGRSSLPDASPAAAPAPFDPSTLEDIDKLAHWLSGEDELRYDIEVSIPQMMRRYLAVAVEVSVLEIAISQAKEMQAATASDSPITQCNTDGQVVAGGCSAESHVTQFPAALAEIVASITADGSAALAGVGMDVAERLLPSMDEIAAEFTDMSQAASWSWWYSRQEIYLSAPRAELSNQRERAKVVRKLCEASPMAQEFFRTVATNRVWSEQAREQLQLSTAQLEAHLEEGKRRGENGMRMILRRAIVRYVVAQPGIRDARVPAEALAAQLYRHLASLQVTQTELSQASSDLGVDASLIGSFVRASTHALKAYKSVLQSGSSAERADSTATTTTTTTTTTTSPGSGMNSNGSAVALLDNNNGSGCSVKTDSSVNLTTVDHVSDSSPNLGRDLKPGNLQAAIEAFWGAFTVGEKGSLQGRAPNAAAVSGGSGGRSSPRQPGSIAARKCPLLLADGLVLPPQLSHCSARCTFVKTIHGAALHAINQICALLGSSHYAILRDEPAQQMQSATAGSTLPLFNAAAGGAGTGVSATPSRQSPSVAAKGSSSGAPSVTWDAPRPSTRALTRLQQTLCELHSSIGRNRRVLNADMSATAAV